MIRVTIRQYRDEDYYSARALWMVCGLEVDDPADSREGMARFRARNPEFCLVAEKEGCICGTVMGGFDGRRVWVHHLAVAPECQGRGLGHRLMAELERRALAAGIPGLNLFVAEGNEEVVAFYRHLGYEELRGLTPMRKWLVEVLGE